MKLTLYQLRAELVLELRFSKQKTFAVEVDVVAVGTLEQAADLLDDGGELELSGLVLAFIMA